MFSGRGTEPAVAAALSVGQLNVPFYSAGPKGAFGEAFVYLWQLMQIRQVKCKH